MTFLEKNLALLSVKDADLAQALRNSVVEENQFLLSLCNNIIYLKLPGGNEKIISVDVDLKLEKQPALLIVLGWGDGELVRQGLAMKNVRELLVYEPLPEYLRQVLSLRDETNLLSDKRLAIITGSGEDDVQRKIGCYFDSDLARLTHVYDMLSFTTPGSDQILNRKLFFDNFTKFFSDVFNHKTQKQDPNVEDAFRGLVNTARNFPEYFEWPSWDELKGTCNAKIGVVVGSGPSLSQSLPLLKKYQNKLVIYCCDSNLSILLKNGITPDFVTCIERECAQQYLFTNMPNLEHTYLIGPAVLVPETFAAYNGPKLRCARDVGYENWFANPETRYTIGCSPSHIAYRAAQLMGCETILLVGQDCAYDPYSGNSHDAQSFDHVLKQGEWLKKSGAFGVKTLKTKGNSGQDVLTNFHWVEMAHVIGGLILKSGIKTINVMPESHGLPITGTTRAEPEIIFDQLLAHREVLNKVDLKRIQNTTPQSIHPEIKMRLYRISKGLKWLAENSLAVMQEITDFWLNHDIATAANGNESTYNILFERMEAHHQKILDFDDGFFDAYFYPIINSVHSLVGIEFAKIAYGQLKFYEATMQKMNLLYNWHMTVHLWAMRARNILENENESRWHYWVTKPEEMNLSGEGT